MNKPLPDVDLSSAFAKPSRAAGIKLPPAKKTTPSPPARQRPLNPAPEPETTSKAPKPAPTEAKDSKKPETRSTPTTKKTSETKPATRTERPSTRPAAGQGRLVLWTPVSIRARMQAVQTQEGTLYLDQVLDAIEASVEDLPELVSKATSTPHKQGKLFERAVPSPPAETSAGHRVQLTIRGVLNSQLDIIDQLVESSGAPSRSALINAALDAVLPQPE